MDKGRVDTDQDALAIRAEINNRGTTNLEAYICQELQFTGNEVVLELGSGTGKQTRYLKEHYPGMKIVSVDIAVANNHPEDLPGVVRMSCDMDQLAFSPLFDVVLAVYSIYYSKDMIGLIRRIWRWLKPGGKLVLVGPGDGTNKELISLVNGVQPGTMPPVMRFMTNAQIDGVMPPFAGLRHCGFTNLIKFESRAEFARWWVNHNSYNPATHTAIEAKIPERMVLTKRVVCLILTR